VVLQCLRLHHVNSVVMIKMMMMMMMMILYGQLILSFRHSYRYVFTWNWRSSSPVRRCQCWLNNKLLPIKLSSSLYHSNLTGIHRPNIDKLRHITRRSVDTTEIRIHDICAPGSEDNSDIRWSGISVIACCLWPRPRPFCPWNLEI